MDFMLNALKKVWKTPAVLRIEKQEKLRFCVKKNNTKRILQRQLLKHNKKLQNQTVLQFF